MDDLVICLFTAMKKVLVPILHCLYIVIDLCRYFLYYLNYISDIEMFT